MAVILLYELGEGAPEEALKPDSGALGRLAVALMQANLPAARHRLVALAVMETFVRYARVLQQHAHVVPSAIMTFLDERGMGHPAEVWRVGRLGGVGACRGRGQGQRLIGIRTARAAYQAAGLCEQPRMPAV